MLRVIFFSFLVAGLAACSDGGGSNASQSVPSQPSNPMVNTVNPVIADDFELEVATVATANQAVVPVTLRDLSGAKAASLQFDVVFANDALDLQSVETGQSATVAGKNVEWKLVEPGRARVLIIGMNDSEIAEGEVARLVLNVTNKSKAFQSVTLVNAEGASVAATADVLKARTKPGQVDIQ